MQDILLFAWNEKPPSGSLFKFCKISRSVNVNSNTSSLKSDIHGGTGPQRLAQLEDIQMYIRCTIQGFKNPSSALHLILFSDLNLGSPLSIHVFANTLVKCILLHKYKAVLHIYFTPPPSTQRRKPCKAITKHICFRQHARLLKNKL